LNRPGLFRSKPRQALPTDCFQALILSDYYNRQSLHASYEGIIAQPAQAPCRVKSAVFFINFSPEVPVAKPVQAMEAFIFWSRWLQAPLYLGLIVAQGVYVYQFMHELIILITKTGTLSETEVMLIVLG
jgi:hypothetical protein